jgi:hypothetical protein
MMSEVAKKEMLEALDDAYMRLQLDPWCEQAKSLGAIRRLIEERETWAEEADDMIGFFWIRLPLRIKIFLERRSPMSKPYSNSNWHWFLWLMDQSFKFAKIAFQMLLGGRR